MRCAAVMKPAASYARGCGIRVSIVEPLCGCSTVCNSIITMLCNRWGINTARDVNLPAVVEETCRVGNTDFGMFLRRRYHTRHSTASAQV